MFGGKFPFLAPESKDCFLITQLLKEGLKMNNSKSLVSKERPVSNILNSPELEAVESKWDTA